jgi:hypothetical protein
VERTGIGSGTGELNGGKAMQTNPTQRQGLLLLVIGLALIAVGFNRGGNLILVLGGIGFLSGAVSVLARHKPWAREKNRDKSIDPHGPEV